MALYAIDDLDDALAATRRFLTPVDVRTWLKLALLTFFVGGSSATTSPVQWSFGGNGGGTPTGMGPGPGPVDVSVGPRVWLLVAAVVVVALLLGLLLLLVGSVFEFAFVESLRREEVHVREYWREHWNAGVRLFGFRFALGLLALAGVAILAAPLVFAALGGGIDGASVIAFLALLPFFLILAALVAVVNGFTTAFVVPVMLVEDCGVLAGWRRLWPTITAHWKQYLAYAVAGFLLSIAGGIVVGVLTAILLVVLLIPFGLLFAVGVGGFVLFEPLGIAVFVVVGVLFLLAVLVVVALAQVPVQTYLRYYALFVLGDVEPDFDVVPDQRAAVREA